MTTDPNALINQTYSGTGTAWNNARGDWNTTPTKVFISRDSTSPATVKLYDTNNSSVGWDGQTTWTTPTITSVTGYLNYYYTKNYTAGTTKGVASHELGHAVGLAHETGCVVMVDNTPARKSCGVTAPTSDDINGVNHIYGSLAAGTPTQVRMDVSWAAGYSSVADMARDADAIVVGKTRAVTNRTAPREGLAFTDFAYSVNQWISAPVGSASLPETISIHQTGGVLNGQTVQVSDDPLLVPGEDSILFLRQYAPGKYYILGGPTGRILRNGPQLTQLPGASSLTGLSPSESATLREVKSALTTGPSNSVAVAER